MKKAVLIFISVYFLVFASSAFAGDYFTAKIGPYFPEESALDTGVNIEGAYGLDIYNMTGIENLALEFGLGYYTASGDENYYGSKLKYDFDVISLTTTAVYTLDLSGPFSLYGGGGLGLYYAMLEAKVSDPFFGTYTEDDSELKLGLHLVGGGRFQLNNQLDLTSELKYVAVSDDIGGVSLNFGVKFNF
jgi:opacity protein-like surface antigen